VKKTLIFSDVHLKVAETGRSHQQEFIAFLKQFRKEEYDRIVCLGDLFDVWFEYRHVVFSGYFDVLRALAEFRDAGIELHLVCGNHDFWAGRFLQDEIGFRLHRTAVKLPFGKKDTLLAHGDGLNKSDYGYRLFKRVARNPVAIGAFRLLHPDWAMMIARGMSRGSRTITQKKDTAHGSEARALRAYAQGVLNRGEAEVVICGHAHAPVRETYPTPNGTGLYINSGDWLHHRSHVVWDGNEFHLELGNGANSAPQV
jgi:UDP-2,3-diacylglucosamine hydrolase